MRAANRTKFLSRLQCRDKRLHDSGAQLQGQERRFMPANGIMADLTSLILCALNLSVAVLKK